MRRAWSVGLVSVLAVAAASLGCTPAPPQTSATGDATGETSTSTGGTETSSGTTAPETTSGSSSTSDTGQTTQPPLPECGDGVVGGGEQCDDGNGSNNDACTVTCVAASCGDGLVWEGMEECDDGNLDNDDGCLEDCTPNVCGDGYVNLGVEQCDDANDVNDDDCTNACKLHIPGCGNGILDEGEECDDGNFDDTDDCTTQCMPNVCGDGHVHAELEECDDANQNDNDGCFSDCTLNVCGDGILNEGVEECDDANGDDSDECPASCLFAFCGDGYLHETFEKCDAGEANEDDLYNGCSTECTPNAGCGDGVVQVEEGEQCDDGNTESNDGCSATCTLEAAPECQDPLLLEEPDRNVLFNDGMGGVTECDKTGDSWYRLTGGAGSQMPTTPPEIYACGTDSPGWLNGEHPQVLDGAVDRQVCFHGKGDTCFLDVTIKVRNCGEYYVYKLPDPPDSCLRYCGE
jgi:cysteine-rich repeat protein